VTTVGYGDHYPVTIEGRAVAIVLMTAGVGLFATLSGALAAWFLRPSQRSDVAGLHDDIRALREELRAARESRRAP
jgi:voltage-gated potassium channel